MWFDILILIFIVAIVFDAPIFPILALYLDFKGAKNIHVLQVLILGFKRMLEVSDWGLATGS